jgi:hypothetical protein
MTVVRDTLRKQAVRAAGRTAAAAVDAAAAHLEVARRRKRCMLDCTLGCVTALRQQQAGTAAGQGNSADTGTAAARVPEGRRSRVVVEARARFERDHRARRTVPVPVRCTALDAGADR